MTGAGIIEGLAGFLAYLGLLCVLLRLARNASPAAVAVMTSFATFILGLAWIAVSGRAVNVWAFSVCYWFFVLCFLMVFGALYKSLSLRILLDLSKIPGRTDSYAALHSRYIERESFQSRLNVIQQARFAQSTESGFALTARGRRLAEAAHAMQRVFRIEKSG